MKRPPATPTLPTPELPAYLRRLLNVMPTFRPGAVVVANVVHDDDCPKLRGRECRCSPDITISEAAS